jgi:hypothetical protein
MVVALFEMHRFAVKTILSANLTLSLHFLLSLSIVSSLYFRSVEEEACCLLSVCISSSVEEEACCLLCVFLVVWRRNPIVSCLYF